MPNTQPGKLQLIVTRHGAATKGGRQAAPAVASREGWVPLPAGGHRDVPAHPYVSGNEIVANLYEVDRYSLIPDPSDQPRPAAPPGQFIGVLTGIPTTILVRTFRHRSGEIMTPSPHQLPAVSSNIRSMQRAARTRKSSSSRIT